jgi:hypothetical protein
VLRHALIVCASSALLLHSARAQTAAVSWPPLSHLSESSFYTERPTTPLSPRSFAREAGDTMVKQIRPTHWKEGGIVGAVVLGAFGIWLGNEICQETEAGNDGGCTAKAVVGGAIGGGGLGFLIGALIGGQFPKRPKQFSSDSADVR